MRGTAQYLPMLVVEKEISWGTVDCSVQWEPGKSREMLDLLISVTEGVGGIVIVEISAVDQTAKPSSVGLSQGLVNRANGTFVVYSDMAMSEERV